MLVSKNVIQAIKVQGRFERVRVAVPPGQKQPYPGLKEAGEKKSTLDFYDLEGTMVGFRFPQYMEGVNTPGYHFHFLSSDRRKGGHVIEFTPAKAKIQIDHSTDYQPSPRPSPIASTTDRIRGRAQGGTIPIQLNPASVSA